MARTAAPRTTSPDTPAVTWNVLTTPWLEVMDARARLKLVSVLDALRDAPDLHQIVAAAPLDLFAIHRFLVTLLYWQAEDANGVVKLRKALLAGRVPGNVVKGLRDEADQFELFDAKRPFLQDPRVKDSEPHTAAYLFAEMASGTNIAHFQHGDDDAVRLCLNCATRGLLRLIPWIQSGGPGLQPALHGAPPIMPLALGQNLCETLGLNLVPLDRPMGRPQWSSQFKPSAQKSGIPLMEGLTWNARCVHLGVPQPNGTCMKCGSTAETVIGPIAFKKNTNCQLDKTYLATWKEPNAFYKDDNVTTVKTSRESEAAVCGDLRRLGEQRFGKKTEPAPISAVVQANDGHDAWLVVMPCTNPANNKSFDHRCEVLKGFDAEALARTEFWHDSVPWQAGNKRSLPQLNSPRPAVGVLKFVRLASALDSGSWAVVEQAAGLPLNQSPAAFDIFTGLYWPLRNRDRTVPSRNAAWLALKLMAAAGRLRPQPRYLSGPYEPWRDLALRDSPAKSRVYPKAIPQGRHLEAGLREVIRRHAQKPSAARIDWPGLCQLIHNLTP
jgi:hypothetical protein